MKRKCWKCVYRKRCPACKKIRIVSQLITDLKYEIFLKKVSKEQEQK